MEDRSTTLTSDETIDLALCPANLDVVGHSRLGGGSECTDAAAQHYGYRRGRGGWKRWRAGEVKEMEEERSCQLADLWWGGDGEAAWGDDADANVRVRHFCDYGPYLVRDEPPIMA